MRQVYKENAKQDKDLNQHTSLYYSIYIKSYASNSTSNI